MTMGKQKVAMEKVFPISPLHSPHPNISITKLIGFRNRLAGSLLFMRRGILRKQIIVGGP